METMRDTPQQNQEAALRTYLLGQAAGKEQRRIEQRLLTDSSYFDELLRVEESLTDEYVRGEIEGIEKQQFDNYFLKSPEHQRDLVFARLLERYFSRQEIQRSVAAKSLLAPRWRLLMEASLVCAALVLIAVSVLQLRKVTNLRGQVERLQAARVAAEQQQQLLATQVEEQRQQVSGLIQELARLQGSELTNTNTVSLALTSGVDRSATQNRTATLTAHIHWLRLDLNFEGRDYPSYQAEVQTAEGRAIWKEDKLNAHPGGNQTGKTVEITLAAARLPGSDYLVVLTGIAPSGTSERIGAYYLHLARR